jgi:hypothetical protein
MIESAIYQSFCDLQIVMLSVQRAWAHQREVSGLWHAVGDARHHCCCAAAFLVDFERDNTWRPGDVHDLLSDVDRMVAHEAYVSVTALGPMLRSAIEDHLPGAPEIERALLAVGALLDTLEPFASADDRALRAIVLGDGDAPVRVSGPADPRTLRPAGGQLREMPMSF